MEFHADGAGKLDGFHQVGQRVDQAEIADTGGYEGAGDISDLADGGMDISGAAVDQADTFLAIGLCQLEVELSSGEDLVDIIVQLLSYFRSFFFLGVDHSLSYQLLLVDLLLKKLFFCLSAFDQ